MELDVVVGTITHLLPNGEGESKIKSSKDKIQRKGAKNAKLK